MTYDELNKYILNYVEHNKTNSAVMLAGGWGTGKSYYIQHTLKPFLKDEGKDCVVVSLYGLKELSEISKAIYLEARLKKINPKSEVAKAGIIAGKTIVKGVASFFSIDLNQNDDDLNALYSSMDLSDKLIILEDLERTSIDIIELLGYINNFVEQDGVKVLLVANEDEITREVELTKKSEKGKTEIIFDETNENIKAYKYYKIKEKTISDTITFESDFQEIIFSILKHFENDFLNKYKTQEFCSTIQNMFYTLTDMIGNITLGRRKQSKINFRTFIFATQKFVDLLQYIELDKYPQKYIDSIYFGIINFSVHFKKDKSIKWDGNDNYSIQLGYNNCPLYRFCFDYIVNQDTNRINIDECYKDYLDLYNHESNLIVFKNYASYTEKEVVDSIKDLEDKIAKNEISLGAYGEILYYLVTFEKNIEYDISSFFKLMMENVKGKADKLGNKTNFYFGRQFDDKDMKSRYDELSDALIQSANQVDDLFTDFSYNIETLAEECRKLDQLYYEKYRDRPFLIRIDVQRFAELFIKCSATQMIEIRTLFQTIYKNNKTLANPEEYSTMKHFIETLENCDKSKCDKIQQLHIKWFIVNLNDYCKTFNQSNVADYNFENDKLSE